MRRLLLVPAVAVALAGCGTDDEPVAEGAAGAGGWADVEQSEATPGFDPLDPALSLLPESAAAEDRLLRRLGTRDDFRIPRRVVEDLEDGPLARAVVARIWHELQRYESDPRYRRLTPGQRALFALQWADVEILNGGFDQLWSNSAGFLAADLEGAARRVGSEHFAAIFRDAARLWPGGRIPRDRAERQRLLDGIDGSAVAALDQRYYATQDRRETALALILARYVRAHPDEFFAG